MPYNVAAENLLLDQQKTLSGPVAKLFPLHQSELLVEQIYTVKVLVLVIQA